MSVTQSPSKTSSSSSKNDQLSIVLVGDIFPSTSLSSTNGNEANMTQDDLLLDVTVGPELTQGEAPVAPCSPVTRPAIDLDAVGFSRDAMVRMARRDGISLAQVRANIEEARLAVAAQELALAESPVEDDDDIVGYVEVSKRKVRKVIRRSEKKSYPDDRKVAEQVTKLSKASRRAKWEAFEEIDSEDFINAATAQGMVPAFITLALPKVKDWMKLYAPTVATLKGKDGTLQKTLRTLGSKFEVEGFGKSPRCVWVAENSERGIKRPHFHLVMMVPAVGAEEFIRKTWMKKNGFVEDEFAAGVVHVSMADSDDDRSAVEVFRDMTRYISKNKFNQERVNDEWLRAGENIGDMWDVRGFERLSTARFEIKRKDVAPIKTVLSEVTSRPRESACKSTGELTVNQYPRWDMGNKYGNREIMDDTTDIVEYLISTGVLRPVDEEGASLN